MIIQKVKNGVKKVVKKIYFVLFTKHIRCDVRELFFQHNSEKDFLRYDIIVRLLAIENIYGNNEYGLDFYRRMQSIRVSPDWVDESVVRFKNLIESFNENGFDKNSKIELDSNLELIDGSHRMALALYHNVKYISCMVRPKKYNIFYGIEWFIINGFSKNEIEILKAKYKQVYNQALVPFTCTIWPAAQDYFDEITEHLSLFGQIVEVKDFEYNDFNFNAIVRGVYFVDDIKSWKIRKKIKLMSSSNNKKIRMIQLVLEDPNFRLKTSNNNTLSKKCEHIKGLIRDAYKNKIKNYFHDIIIHIGDNFYQNEHIRSLFKVNLDVEAILSSISDINYVITKFDVPYIPKDFPTSFPIGKDIDIICLPEEFEILSKRIENKLSNIKDCTVRFINKSNSHHLFRVEINSFLIYQFDISAQIQDVEMSFLREMISNKIYFNNIPIASIDYEYVIRMNEIKKNPKKAHHQQFIIENKDKVNQSISRKYFLS